MVNGTNQTKMSKIFTDKEKSDQIFEEQKAKIREELDKVQIWMAEEADRLHAWGGER